MNKFEGLSIPENNGCQMHMIASEGTCTASYGIDCREVGACIDCIYCSDNQEQKERWESEKRQ